MSNLISFLQACVGGLFFLIIMIIIFKFFGWDNK